jgi:hypothetical protein
MPMLQVNCPIYRGIVQGILRWVEIGINQQVFSSVGALDMLFLILNGHHFRFCKTILLPLEPELSVMWEQICEMLKMM